MYMSTPVADGDYVYGFSNKRKGQIVCLEQADRRAQVGDRRTFGMNAAIQSAGPNLLVLTTEGELIVAPRNPEKFEELRRYKVADESDLGAPGRARIPRRHPRRRFGCGLVAEVGAGSLRSPVGAAGYFVHAVGPRRFLRLGRGRLASLAGRF